MANRATIVYFYPRDAMPHDGGGLRILAWESALTSLGYSVDISPLNRSGPLPDSEPSMLTRAKRTLAPMPFSRSIPALPPSDLYVVTVQGAFASAAHHLDRDSLIFDWMDVWSINSRNMGASSTLSYPGALAQSHIWRRREKHLPSKARHNTFAGYGDLEELSRVVGRGGTSWLPTPTTMVNSKPRGQSVIRRVGFLGNFGYQPNEMSLKKFFRQYGSQLAAAHIEVVVAGFASERVKAWGVPATVLGTVENLDSFYNEIDAVIVPIEHGGGIKVKAVEALARGLTVFGTDEVRKGFSLEFSPSILRIDSLFDPDRRPTAAGRTQSDQLRFETRFCQQTFTNSLGEILAQW